VFKKSKREYVISETDLVAARDYLASKPHAKVSSMPGQWSVEQTKSWLLECIPKHPGVGESFEFGTGLWGHVKPLGYEFSNYKSDEERYQIVVSVRSAKTDLDALISIEIT